jgi:Concanavalin A-like lectin/glucanases superfamily/Prealbumin-like fold domain
MVQINRFLRSLTFTKVIGAVLGTAIVIAAGTLAPRASAATGANSVTIDVVSGTHRVDGTPTAFNPVAVSLLQTSNNLRLVSGGLLALPQGIWPKNASGFDENRYMEFVFDANQVPANAIIRSVTLTQEYQRTNLIGTSNLNGAKLEIWNGTDFSNEFPVTIGGANSDVTQTFDLSSFITTPAQANALKARFLAYRASNGNTWTSHDLMNVTVTYDFPPACSTASTFDDFFLGSVNGQSGWSATNPAYDQAIVSNVYGYDTFGCQTLRVSDAVTSGSFGDWIFTPSNTNEAGETTAFSNGMSGGTRQNHFEAQFDIASTVPGAEQPGLHVSVSPDRGDGARMSYLRFEDQADGIHVFFDDVTNAGPVGTGSEFNETDIATLDRTIPHTAKFVMDLFDGASNDVVKIYIDGNLVTTGGSWENYYRFDPEQTPSGNQVPTVDSLIIQARGTAAAGTAGNGFVFDNFDMSSSIVVPPPTTGTVLVTKNAIGGEGTFSITLNGDAQTAPVNGLVGHWNFNENSGTTTADSSGNGNTGTLINTSAWVPSNAVEHGSAITFNGTTDYVHMPSGTNFADNQDHTFAAWVNTNTIGSFYQWIINNGGTLTGTSLIIHQNHPAFFYNGGGALFVDSSTNIVPGTWYHLAAAYNGTTKQVTMYVNGVPTVTSAPIASAWTADTASVEIGRWAPGNTWYFSGAIDEPSIYNRALSDAEVNQLYQSSSFTSDTRSIASGGTVSYEVTPGTYNVTEASTEGWAQTDNTCESVVVVAGQVTPCTITNTVAPSTVTVTIDKYLNGQPATAEATQSASFPMESTWNAENIGSGTGTYSLSPVGFNSANAYEAVTADMTSGASYTTHETSPESCTAAYPYKLVGYTSGSSLEDAAAQTPTAGVPDFADITSNEYVIVWNVTCPPAPTLLTPANGSVLTTATWPLADWSDVTDWSAPSTYLYESATSPAINPDGSFVTPIYVSGVLATSEIPTAGTPDGTYYWHARAVDAFGNAGPWADAFVGTIDNTVPDTEAPVVTVLPAAGSTLSGTVVFTITVTDNQPLNPAILTNIYSYLYNNLPPQAAQGASVDLSTGTGTLTVDTTQLVNGLATLDVGQLFDAAGNASGPSDNYFSDYVIDNTVPDVTAPTATFIFPTPGPAALSFQVVYSEPVNSTEATDPANYFLNNWPGAGGSGDLAGDATVTYDGPSNTATVTFTNPGWYVSAEQQWGVQNVHDLANNVIDPNPTTAYSSPLVAPEAPGTPTTATPTTSGTQDWTWTAATDPGDADASGVKTYEYSVSGGATIDWTDIGNVLGVTTNLGVGSYTLHVRATDNAGNVGPESSGDVLVTSIPEAPATYKVHIFKHLDNGETIAQIPNDSTAPNFPMIATYSIAGIGTNLDPGDGYVLGNGGGVGGSDGELRYAANTIALHAGDRYGTHEVTDGSVVVASSESCTPGKYYLVGYKTGTSFESAQGATISSESPDFVSIANDEYVIVVNHECPEIVLPTTGSITVYKNVINPNGDEVSDAQTFPIQLNSSNERMVGEESSVTYSELAPGTYTITETPNGNYDFMSFSQDLDGETSGAQITVVAGENTDLTIVNKQKPGSLTVKKVVQNPNGSTATASDFSFRLNGGDPIPFIATEDEMIGENDFSNMAPGTYNITEDEVSGSYAISYDNCEVEVPVNGQPSESTTCTITNSDIPDGYGAVTVVKNVVNDNGGEATVNDFTLQITDNTAPAPTFETLDLTPGQTINVSSSQATFLTAGHSYTVSEVNPFEDTYKQTGISCTSGGSPIEGSTFTLDGQKSVVCTITNDDIAPKLTLVKNVVNTIGYTTVGTATSGDWTLYASSTTDGISGRTGEDSITEADVDAGTYNLSEGNGPEGYTASSWSCAATDQGGDDDLPQLPSLTLLSDAVVTNTVTLALGDDVTCTITNTAQAAHLTIVKETDAASGDGDFQFTVNGTSTAGAQFSHSVINLETDGNIATSGDILLPAGTFDVNEINLGGGWHLADTSCSYDNESEGNTTAGGEQITVDAGDYVTCTFTNTKQGTLIVKKLVINDDHTGTANAGDFSFQIDGGTPVAFAQDPESAGQATNNVVVTVGTHSVTEVDAPGYTTTYSEGCDAMNVSGGESATCTITNDDIASEDTPTGGGGSVGVGGNIAGGGGGGGGSFAPTAPQGQVLGEATTTPSTESSLGTSCSVEYISAYLGRGRNNDPAQVKKLQQFLNDNLGTKLPITGFFGNLTYNAVKQFQLKYGNDILVPWVPFGQDPLKPTGFVYKTTKWKINVLMCPAGEILPVMPQLP